MVYDEAVNIVSMLQKLLDASACQDESEEKNDDKNDEPGVY